MKEQQLALTTFDNPYNPFEQFSLWYLYDKQHDYNTCEKIARLANLRDDMTQKEEDAEIERVMDRLIEIDLIMYKKVKREIPFIEPMTLNED